MFFEKKNENWLKKTTFRAQKKWKKAIKILQANRNSEWWRKKSGKMLTQGDRIK